ncbi:MAG TPA: heme o synthase [Thermoanaerobaculia bacterium]|nr:heme o synthase [Thermoanaerobaculia bacterium]
MAAEAALAVPAAPRPRAAVLVADLVTLTKPRITVMVALTAAAGFVMASPAGVSFWLLLATLAGTGLVAAGASGLNQVVEHEHDACMIRTADRPLAAGRMHPDAGLAFSVAVAVAGVALLAATVNLLTACLGALTLAGYVFVYTPMKRVSSLSTVVGAFPGAVPPMMGWTAAAGTLEPGAWALFGILFLWQLPHFLAIAWLCRDDYARAGYPMISVSDGDGSRTARQAVLYAAALVPVSLLPVPLELAGGVYFAGALLLSTAYLAASFGFLRRPDMATSRWLLLASVLYLPGVLAVMLLDRALL